MAAASQSTIFVEVDRPKRSLVEEVLRDLNEKLRVRNEVLRSLIESNQQLAKDVEKQEVNKNSIVSYLESALLDVDRNLELQHKILNSTRAEVEKLKKEIVQEEKRGKEENNRLVQVEEIVKMNMEAKESSMNQLITLRDSLIDTIKERKMLFFKEQNEAQDYLYILERGDIIKYHTLKLEASKNSQTLMEDMLKVNESQLRQQIVNTIVKLGKNTNKYKDLSIETVKQLDKADEALHEVNQLKQAISIGKQNQNTIVRKINKQVVCLKSLVERCEKLKAEAKVTAKYAILSNDLIKDYNATRNRYNVMKDTMDEFVNFKKDMMENYKEMDENLAETEDYNKYIQTALYYAQTFLSGLCNHRMEDERIDDYEHRRINLIIQLLSFLILASKAEHPDLKCDASVFDFNFARDPYRYQLGDLGLVQRPQHAPSVLVVVDRAVQCANLSFVSSLYKPQYRDVAVQSGHGIIDIRFTCLKEIDPCKPKPKKCKHKHKALEI